MNRQDCGHWDEGNRGKKERWERVRAAYHDHYLCVRPDAVDALNQLDESVLVRICTNVIRTILVICTDIDNNQISSFVG